MQGVDILNFGRALVNTATLTRTPIRDHKSHIDRYFAYIYARQLIWYRRFVEKLPPPWADDETLRNFSFTNIYRELDRGTIHYREVAWPLISQTSIPMQFWWTTLYRWFNRTEIWDEIFATECEFYSETPDLSKLMKKLRAHDGPVWSGAFMTCAYANSPGKDKIERVMNFLRVLYKDRAMLDPSRWHLPTAMDRTEKWHSFLQRFDGIGPFNAYEIMSDLLMVRWKPFAELNWSEDDWANPGPGAERGLRLVFSERGQTTFSRSAMVSQMRQLRDMQRDKFGELELPFQAICLHNETAPDTWFPRYLTMRNIEHNLCEYSKYDRGRARNKFVLRTKV